MNVHETACDKIAAIYDEKRANGLIDVKFLVQNREEASHNEACAELELLNAAVQDGLATDLDFGDLDWKE